MHILEMASRMASILNSQKMGNYVYKLNIVMENAI